MIYQKKANRLESQLWWVTHILQIVQYKLYIEMQMTTGHDRGKVARQTLYQLNSEPLNPTVICKDPNTKHSFLRNPPEVTL